MRIARSCLLAVVAVMLIHCGSGSGPGDASSYKLGGTVSGLQGSGLILRVNTGESLTIAASTM